MQGDNSVKSGKQYMNKIRSLTEREKSLKKYQTNSGADEFKK